MEWKQGLSHVSEPSKGKVTMNLKMIPISEIQQAQAELHTPLQENQQSSSAKN
jgi:hypothetical protein